MRILVYEHASGGGFARKPIPNSILCEGFGMLRTLAGDLHAAGHSVTTLLDSRISAFHPPLEADCVQPVSTLDQTKLIMEDKARSVDAAFVIAPESDGVLESTVMELEKDRLPLANSLSRVIALVSDKYSMLEHARKIGIPTPNSLTFSIREDASEASRVITEKIGFPAVLKPNRGTAMTGLSLVKSKTEVKAAVEKITKESTIDQFIAQEYVKGVPASVSLISTGEEAVAMSLNKQRVTLASAYSTSKYEGGEVPLESQIKHETMNAAKRIVESYRELKGYVGVDFVLTKEDPVLIEVNPRLTTSYVGLREVAPFNAAEAMFNAAIHHRLPANASSNGYACFTKIEMPSLPLARVKETFKMRDVISPPFPVSDNSITFALVCSKGTTLLKAAAHLEETKRRLGSLSRAGGS